METKPFASITVQLEQQYAQLSANAENLRSELEIIDDCLARINAAKATLSGEARLTTASRPTNKERKKSAAPSANKAQVIDLMAKELSRQSPLPEVELKTRIEEKLIDSGHGRSGYALRFKEALADSRFQTGVDGVSLNRTETSLQNGNSQATSQLNHEHIGK